VKPLVLVIGPVPPPVHGAARVTAQIVDNLRAAGATVTAVDTSGPDTASRLGYHVARLRIHLGAAWQALRARRRPVSLYVTGAGGLGLWYQVLLIGAGRLAGHRLVFHHHSYAYVTNRSAAMRALATVGGRRLEHVALCDGMARSLQQSYRTIERVRVCSNAGLFDALDVEPAAADPGPPRDDDTLVLGHLGNISVEKGLAVVLDTFRRVQAGGVPSRLLLAGPVQPGEAAQLLAAARIEFGPAIEHLGPIDPAEVESFYRRLDAFIFPSRYQHEAEPMVVLEASRCGVPTVAFQVGCLAALVHDPDWLVNPAGDFPAAAARVLSGLTDDAQRGAARRAVLERFADRQRSAVLAQRRLRDTLMGAVAS
jgi:glycosyltransferase involved in cell wall biosynthesis